MCLVLNLALNNLMCLGLLHIIIFEDFFFSSIPFLIPKILRREIEAMVWLSLVNMSFRMQ